MPMPNGFSLNAVWMAPAEPEEAMGIAHSPAVNSAVDLPSRPPYTNTLSFDHSARVWRSLIRGASLNLSSVSRPPKPLALVEKGRLCQAPKFSIIVQVCHWIVMPQGAPDA